MKDNKEKKKKYQNIVIIGIIIMVLITIIIISFAYIYGLKNEIKNTSQRPLKSLENVEHGELNISEMNKGLLMDNKV